MKTYDYKLAEQSLQKKWNEEQVYAYDNASKKPSFIIDTPPPTVSGSLHIGHIFSYTQTDIIARFHRMTGKKVFYPMGWDNNGLPTEKRTQNTYAIKCDSSLAYDPSFKAQVTSKKPIHYQSISRKNFTELCHKQNLEDEKKYKQLWSHIALSVDWNQSYRTIDPYSQFLSQISFLDLYKKNLIESRVSPCLWDTQFQTAVAQADIEDKDRESIMYHIVFALESGQSCTIASTRPELLPACVALAAHPEDSRYKKYFGQQARSPLFYRSIPIIPSQHARPDKGTGLLMICTFGDMEDVDFCKKHNMPILQVINDEGLFKDICFKQGLFKSLKAQEASKNYSHLQGLRVRQARKKIVHMLQDKSYIIKVVPQGLKHVKFYEKGDFPLEILAKRQWYIKLLDHKELLLQQGQKIHWQPKAMQKRYEQWVEGLNQDWCISRQRHYGIPFPVWYPIDAFGKVDYNKTILPKQELSLSQNKNLDFTIEPQELIRLYNTSHKLNMPIDPLTCVPPGFQEEQRDQKSGFTADTNVMDTWACSSLTPYINSGWVLNAKKHKEMFPADLRPQAHEIIRTWAFYTIAKSCFHENKIPWKNIAISGWVLASKNQKMSKSKGNALEPQQLIDTYSADAIRYWAAKTRLGQDTSLDTNVCKVGKRLTTKLFNVFRFIQIQLENTSFIQAETSLKQVSSPIDRAWILHLLHTMTQATNYLQTYQHAEALNVIEKSFWFFCDYYMELIKARVYQLKELKEGLSGKHSLDYSLYLFIQLFAPYLPYITESIWSKRYNIKTTSLHKSCWMTPELIKKQTDQLHALTPSLKQVDIILESACMVLEQVRKQKSDQNKSLASQLQELQIQGNDEQIQSISLFKEDLSRAACVDVKNIFLKKEIQTKKILVKIIFK